jgi:hypothetical protein
MSYCHAMRTCHLINKFASTVCTYMYYQYSTVDCIFKPVLRIRDILARILIRIRILGSVSLTNRSDADPGGPKTYGSYGSGSGTRVHLHHSSKIKSHKGFFSYFFFLMMEGSGDGSRAESGAGSVLVNNGTEYRSGRPKNIRILWIRILNIDLNLADTGDMLM